MLLSLLLRLLTLEVFLYLGCEIETLTAPTSAVELERPHKVILTVFSDSIVVGEWERRIAVAAKDGWAPQTEPTSLIEQWTAVYPEDNGSCLMSRLFDVYERVF